MAITRSKKIAVKDLGKARLAGPTCLGPLTKERLAAMYPTPRVLPPVVRKSPAKREIGLSKCIQTTYTLTIYPKPGVSIVEDLEPAVRTINSPCRNLLWGRANVVEESDTSSDTTAGSDTDGGMTRALRIILIHGNDNHNGNIHRDTVAMFQPTPWDPRDLALEQQEIISLDQILAKIRSWKDKVQSCVISDSLVQELTVMVRKGPGFPNGMGNEKRYPAPWDVKVWDERVAERKAKEVAYKTTPRRRAPKKK